MQLGLTQPMTRRRALIRRMQNPLPISPSPRKLVAPKTWPAGHPLPTVASNCAACHLTAGRELTDAVVHFVRSVHDLNGLTCYDCHGGNREEDGRAHEEAFGFIGTKLSAHLKVCSECHSRRGRAAGRGAASLGFFEADQHEVSDVRRLPRQP